MRDSGYSTAGSSAYHAAVAGDFTDLIAWQQAEELAAEVAELLPKIRGYAADKAREQLITAAESIPANIAEGYGRGYGRDFARFLRIAAASGVEVENHLRTNVKTKRLLQREVESAIARTRRVRALLRGLYLKVIGTTEARLRRRAA